MTRVVLGLLLMLCVTSQSFAALSVGTVFELNASATASNVNAGGFNTQNANFLTNLACTSATGTTPSCTSASLNFVAAHDNHWLFIRSGTDWNTSGAATAGGGCYWKITSTAGNAATLNAAVGAGVCLSSGTMVNDLQKWRVNTSAGVATVASPTSGTFGLDYSQATAAGVAITDGVIGAATTELTSVLTPVDVSWVGNLIHTNSGTNCTVGWYEVVSVSGTTATVDRSLGTAASICTQKVGGAMSLNSTLDDDLFENGLGTNGTGAMIFWVKNGSYTLGESVAFAAAGGTQAPIVLAGFNALRSDLGTITQTNRPVITFGAQTGALGTNWDVYNLSITGTGTPVLTLGGNSKVVNSKIANTSVTAARIAVTLANQSMLLASEVLSYRGNALSIGSNSAVVAFSYIHDSDKGFTTSSTGSEIMLLGNIFAGNITNAVATSSTQIGRLLLLGNTIYGAENKLGTCVSLATGTTDVALINNIITGCVTGLSHANTQDVGFDDYNSYYNNTTDVTNWVKGSHNSVLNPTFTSVAQLTGSTATTSGSVLTQSGGDFSTVVDGQDYLYLVSGTGVTVGIYGITAHTATTVTLDIAPGTNATADKVWQITTGRNFALGTNLQALGFPGAFPGGLSTGYMDIGAVQRQEAGSGGGPLIGPGRLVR